MGVNKRERERRMEKILKTEVIFIRDSNGTDMSWVYSTPDIDP